MRTRLELPVVIVLFLRKESLYDSSGCHRLTGHGRSA